MKRTSMASAVSRRSGRAMARWRDRSPWLRARPARCRARPARTSTRERGQHADGRSGGGGHGNAGQAGVEEPRSARGPGWAQAIEPGAERGIGGAKPGVAGAGRRRPGHAGAPARVAGTGRRPGPAPAQPVEEGCQVGHQGITRAHMQGYATPAGGALSTRRRGHPAVRRRGLEGMAARHRPATEVAGCLCEVGLRRMAKSPPGECAWWRPGPENPAVVHLNDRG